MDNINQKKVYDINKLFNTLKFNTTNDKSTKVDSQKIIKKVFDYYYK